MHRGAFFLSRQTTILSFDDARRDAFMHTSSRVAPLSREQILGDLPSFESPFRQSSGAASSERAVRPVVKTGQRSASQNAPVRTIRSVTGRTEYRQSPQKSVAEEPRVAKKPQEKPSRFAAMKKTVLRNKADRAFNKQFGGADKAPAASEAGPRAAVYKGQMGSKQRQAVRMQNSGSSSSKGFNFSLSGLINMKSSPVFMVLSAVVACLVFTCVFLYPTAQLYYQEVRENARLEAEYAAIEQRNESLDETVSALQTDAGVEDAARQNYGWIYEGEQTATVAGLNIDEDEDSFIARVVSGSVEAPETWYSPFLDTLFGVE